MPKRFMDIWLPFIGIGIFCIIGVAITLLMSSRNLFEYGLPTWIILFMSFLATWFSLVLYKRTHFAFFFEDRLSSVGLILLWTILVLTFISMVLFSSLWCLPNFIFASISFMVSALAMMLLIPIIQRTNPYNKDKS